jgi:hypothetical protein
VAALIAGLAFVAEQARRLTAPVVPAAALIAGLALIPQLARRLIGERRWCTRQREQAREQDYRSFASHGRDSFLPPDGYMI